MGHSMPILPRWQQDGFHPHCRHDVVYGSEVPGAAVPKLISSVLHGLRPMEVKRAHFRDHFRPIVSADENVASLVVGSMCS